MIFSDLQLIVNESYSNFFADYIKRKRLGSDEKYSHKNLFLVKCIYKVLFNQEGDETKDTLTKEQIQNIITLFNRYSNSTIPIEYD